MAWAALPTNARKLPEDWPSQLPEISAALRSCACPGAYISRRAQAADETAPSDCAELLRQAEPLRRGAHSLPAPSALRGTHHLLLFSHPPRSLPRLHRNVTPSAPLPALHSSLQALCSIQRRQQRTLGRPSGACGGSKSHDCAQTGPRQLLCTSAHRRSGAWERATASAQRCGGAEGCEGQAEDVLRGEELAAFSCE